jgi:hypothetical protein
VRFGTEFFHGTIFGSLIGSAPVVSERFSLQIQAREIAFSLESDNAASGTKPASLLAGHLDFALDTLSLYRGLKTEIGKIIRSPPAP